VQQPTPSPETLEKLANGLAQLQDFRLLFYVLIVLIFAMFAERWFASYGMRKEREKMWTVADKFSEAAKDWGAQTDKLVVELQVLRALTSRVESNEGRG
jgi:hypothetical protein